MPKWCLRIDPVLTLKYARLYIPILTVAISPTAWETCGSNAGMGSLCALATTLSELGRVVTATDRSEYTCINSEDVSGTSTSHPVVAGLSCKHY